MPRILQYPSDLGTQADLLHYVMFFINVRNRPAADFGGATRTDVLVAPGGAGGIAPTEQGITNLGAMATERLGNLLPTGTNQLVRLDTAIALHLDEKPVVRYSAKYNEVDNGALGLFAQALAGDQSAVGGSRGGFNSDFFVGLLSNALAAATRGYAPGGLGSISGLAKMRLNNFKQAFFDAMDFRAFTFRYRFFPASAEESEAVFNIIRLFKYHMHPELAQNVAFMIYPSEFDIMYMWGDNENPWLHKISTCVLQDMTVQYGGENFSSFTNGAPTEIYMNLTFREISPLTKQRIGQGY